MKVSIAAAAWDDLRGIAGWIARDDPERAISYTDELLDACEALAIYPRIYPRWPHRSNREIRRFNHNDHAIFYEVRDADVKVLGFLHAARDLLSLIDER